MTLKEKIQRDLKEAMKEGRLQEVSALRFLNSLIINREKEKRARIAKENPNFGEEDLVKKSQLTDEELIEVIAGEFKRVKEAVLEFERGKREDLVKKAQSEIEILKRYLPEQLSEEELKKIVQDTVSKVGAKEARDIGRVMAEVMPQVKGRAEGALVSKIVKEILSR